MMTFINLIDEEDASSILISLDDEWTGAVVHCTNHHGDKLSLIVDDRLLKQLCNQVSKAIKSRAQKTNECGYVEQEMKDYDKD